VRLCLFRVRESFSESASLLHPTDQDPSVGAPVRDISKLASLLHPTDQDLSAGAPGRDVTSWRGLAGPTCLLR